MKRYPLLRRVILRPYRKGAGPAFTLTMWDTGRTDWRGAPTVAYTFREVTPAYLKVRSAGWTLFEGEDYHPATLYAADSDEAVKGLLGFLTLRPGDTDAEYFENYTPQQLRFCQEHAEAVALEAFYRFGEDA